MIKCKEKQTEKLACFRPDEKRYQPHAHAMQATKYTVQYFVYCMNVTVTQPEISPHGVLLYCTVLSYRWSE